MNRREFLAAGVGGLCGMAGLRASLAQDTRAPSASPNVLFIAVDDLRPMLGCYGAQYAKTPHLDRLAQRGRLFERAYCQDAVCSPSRTSVLTGLRPDSTAIFDNATHFRRYLPDVVTLPQHFKQHGYHTQALGKIFHSCFDKAYVGRTLDDPPSWSAPSWYPPPQYYHTPEGERVAREIFARRPDCGRDTGGICIHNRLQEPAPPETVDRSPEVLDEGREHFVQGLISEAPDVADDVPYDGQLAAKAVQTIRGFGEDPWFLAVGFMKPHTPYVAPKQYWDLYNPADLELAIQEPPDEMPPVALLARHDHYAYVGGEVDGPLEADAARRLVHGYCACVSFIDAQVGRLLEALAAAGQRDNTIVVLWGDHGYHLGEQSRWGKQTCFEAATRAPLIVDAPGMPMGGAHTRALVELVDVYPSLCRLAGLPEPAHLEGTSFVPLVDEPARTWKSAAFSQFPRPVRLSTPEHPPQPGDCMGYSIRTGRYRLTVWREILVPEKDQGIELYDYRRDPIERVNLAPDPAFASVVQDLKARLAAGWKAARPHS